MKVWAVRHLRTEVVIGEAADPKAEPLVFEKEVMMGEGVQGEVVVNLGESLDSCLFHRLEVPLITFVFLCNLPFYRSRASSLTDSNLFH